MATIETKKIPTEVITSTLTLELPQYLDLSDDVEPGVYHPSPVFKVGGHDWKLRFYPAGLDYSCAGYASVELILVSPPTVYETLDIGKFRRTLKTTQLSAFNSFLSKLSLRSHQDREEESVRAKFKVSMIEKKFQNQIASVDEVQHLFKVKDGFSLSQEETPGWCCPNFIGSDKLHSLSRQGNDCFTITCVLSVVKESPPLEILDDLESMLKDGRGSDITLVAGGKEFSAHKSILAARSSVFRELLYGPNSEKDLSRLAINDVKPHILEMLLQFIYTEYVPPCVRGITFSPKDIRQLLLLAQRYDLSKLKSICEEGLGETKRWDLRLESSSKKHKSGA